ncbi:hypothetical protein GGI09_003836 [Coemansia sp. S100]|nr:hypothetical protein GGI09_003836 [Coemansia sp. S100]
MINTDEIMESLAINEVRGVVASAVSEHKDAIKCLLKKYALIMEKLTSGQPVLNGPEMEINLKEGMAQIMH